MVGGERLVDEGMGATKVQGDDRCLLTMITVRAARYRCQPVIGSAGVYRAVCHQPVIRISKYAGNLREPLLLRQKRHRRIRGNRP